MMKTLITEFSGRSWLDTQLAFKGLRRPRLHINLHPLCREHDRPVDKNGLVFALLSQIWATQKQLTEAFNHTQLLPPVAPYYSADQVSPC